MQAITDNCRGARYRRDVGYNWGVGVAVAGYCRVTR